MRISPDQPHPHIHKLGASQISLPTPGNIDSDPAFILLTNKCQADMETYNSQYALYKTLPPPPGEMDHAGLAVISAMNKLKAYFDLYPSPPTAMDPTASAIYNVLTKEVPLGSPGGATLAALCAGPANVALDYFTSWTNLSNVPESIFSSDSNASKDGTNIYINMYRSPNDASFKSDSTLQAAIVALQKTILAYQNASAHGKQGAAEDLADAVNVVTKYLSGKTLDSHCSALLDQLNASTSRLITPSLQTRITQYESTGAPADADAISAVLDNDNSAVLKDLSGALAHMGWREGWWGQPPT